MIPNDLNNFIYIAIIVAGTAAATLSIVMNAKVKDKSQQGLEIFFISMFIYIVSDFIAYYFMNVPVSSGAVFALITVSDIMAILTVCTWQYLLLVMADEKKKSAYTGMLIFSGVYAVFSQGISIAFGYYNNGSIEMTSEAARDLTEISSIIYGIFFMAMGIYCFVKITHKEKNMKRTVDIIFAITFLLYMVWIQYWDFTVWFNSRRSLADHYGVDLVLLIYVILSVVFCLYFMKQNPLKSDRTELSIEEAIERTAKTYMLSNREAEVLALVFEGKSNMDIADELFISENTVKRHVNSIFKKTGSKNRHELIFSMRNPGSEN